ncbi:uncharacterized protein isoform X2 [Musca autumnalis]|uniref:uncharacterized protein isoform X2 n=1 Tax=Musca autumnalis TaxID=221902 RepID=UPI003CEC61A5
MDIEGTKMVVGQHRMACIFGGIGLSVRKKKVPGRKVFDLYKKMCLASYFTRPNAYDLTASTFTCVGIFFNVVAHTARSIYPSMETVGLTWMQMVSMGFIKERMVYWTPQCCF